MKILKFIWRWVFKKNFISQTLIPQEIIDKFGKAFDDRFDFDEIFQGKVSILERYDERGIKELINVFVLIFQHKLSEKFWDVFVNTLIAFTNKEYRSVIINISKYLSTEAGLVRKFGNKGEIIISKQMEMIFALMEVEIENS